MPFPDIASSPRPLPPGRVRRSSSKPQLMPAGSPFNTRAPPPYSPPATDPSPRSSTPDLLEQLTGVAAAQETINSPDYTEGNADQMSQEDLEGLLLRAENIIREREQELDMTSQTCKTLSENNANLKARNDALLARIPSSNPSSPISSPPQSFASLSSLSPASGLVSVSNLNGSLRVPSLPRRRPGHARKPSTPAELAALADQNAELLSKLQDLESDAARTEQTGKKRLRALEREIGMLKEELDKTRALGERLEESIQSQGTRSNGTDGKGGLPEEMEKELVKVWKRLAREAKVEEMRAKARPWEIEKTSEPKNFAPGNPLFAPVRTSTPDKRDSTTNHVLPSSSSLNESPIPIQTSRLEASADPDDPFASPTSPVIESITPAPRSATAVLSPGRERALVAQLLTKIAELEETNTFLEEEHRLARARLQEAERQSDGVRALCEFISEEVELEVIDVDDNYGESGNAYVSQGNEYRGLSSRRAELSPRKTIRLRSLGRKGSLNFDSPNKDIPMKDTRLRRFSSMGSLASGSGSHGAYQSQNQVLSQEDGLSAADNRQSIRPRKSFTRMRKSVRGLFESDSFSSSDIHSSSSASFGLPGIAEGPTSPDHEQLQHYFIPPPQVVTTPSVRDLPAEGYVVMEERQLHSLQSELGDNANLGLMPAMGHVRSNSILELLGKAEDESEPVDTSPPIHGSSTGPGISHSISKRGRTSTSRSERMLSTPGSPRVRFAEDDLSMRSASSLNEEVMFPRLRRARSSILASHSSLSLVQMQAASTPKTSSSVFEPSAKAVEHSADDAATEKQKRKQRTKTTALLIELWLWMQFAVVIVVFLFAMARMGPRTFFRKSKTSQRPNA